MVDRRIQLRAYQYTIVLAEVISLDAQALGCDQELTVLGTER